MKKYLILLTSICCATSIQAQQTTPSDALRYTDQGLTGSARFKGMSGAFGAVGGDLSSIHINPAGSGIFNYNTASFTFSYNNLNNKASYFGQNTSEKYDGLDVGQMGAAFVFGSARPSTFQKFVLSINYETTKNFRNNIFIEGINPSESVGNYFLDFANYGNGGTPFSADDLSVHNGETLTDAYSYLGSNYGIAAQQAFLGYQAHIFNPIDVDDSTKGYVSNVGNGPYLQNMYASTSGFNSKLSGNFAAQFLDRFYVGANLNFHFVDYTKHTSVYENSQAINEDQVNQILFENELYTYGGGFSFNIGAIAQVTNELRVGLAYESPTWYRLNDELTQGVSTNKNTVYPNAINVYNRYTVQTPGSFTGSAAYVFGQTGLISFDYTRKDYSNTKFKPGNEFAFVNGQLSNMLTATNEFRVGVEVRLKNISLRGGYRFEESPYKDYKIVGDVNSFSAGIGFDFGGSRLDLAYGHLHRPYDMSLVSSGMQDAARVKTIENTVSLTYNINF